jgi:hypothetical protein
VIRLHKIGPLFICSILVLSIATATTLQLVAADSVELSETSDYTTYYGGTSFEDATKVTFDNEGNTILIGQTSSTNLPITVDAFQSENGGGEWDAFVAKFSPAGDLLFASYFGGSDYEHVTWVNVDADNNIVIAGNTQSTGLPTTPDALHSNLIGSSDGFIAKIAPNGTILYCTYFGGTGPDWIYGMEFDASGNYMFAGWTGSTGLGTPGAYDETFGGATDAFIAKISADGTSLLLFSYLGSSLADNSWTMTIDSSYNYVLSGLANDGFPTSPGANQSSNAGGADIFVAKISSNGNSLLFSTFLGGTGDDWGLGVDVDSQDNILVAGYTESQDINTFSAVQPDYAGGPYDMLVAKFNSTGSPEFITYIGGNATDRCWDIRADADDNAVIVGRTDSIDYPAFDGFNDTKSDTFDACATKISPDGQTIIASTFVGGDGEDIGEGIDADGEGNIVITGRSLSSDFPVTSGAYQEEKAGMSDVFICHTAFTPPSTSITTTPTSTSPPTTPDNPSPDMTLILLAAGGAVIVIVLVVVVTKKR